MYHEIDKIYTQSPEYIDSMTSRTLFYVRSNTVTSIPDCCLTPITLLVAPIFGLIYHTIKASQNLYKGDRERGYAHLKAAGTDLAVGVVVFGLIFITYKLALALPAAFAQTGPPRVL